MRLAGRHLGRLDREARQAVHLVRNPPDHAVRLGREERAPGLGVDLAQQRAAAEHVGLALRVHFGRGEHDVASPRHRQDQVIVVDRVGLLREHDVVRDHLHPVPVEPVDQLRVVATRKRPALVQVLERRIVDPDDDDVPGRRLRPADREADIDGRELLRAQHATGLGRECEQRRADSDAEKKAEPQAARVTHSHPLAAIVAQTRDGPWALRRRDRRRRELRHGLAR